MFGLGYKSRRKLSFTNPTLSEGLVWMPYIPVQTTPVMCDVGLHHLDYYTLDMN
jgi:hypothetical protein